MAPTIACAGAGSSATGHRARRALDRRRRRDHLAGPAHHGSRPAAAVSSTCCASSNAARPCRWARGFFRVFGSCTRAGLHRLRIALSSTLPSSASSTHLHRRRSSSSSAPPSGALASRPTPACSSARPRARVVSASRAVADSFRHRRARLRRRGLLELFGFHIRPLFCAHRLAVAVVETLLWIWLEIDTTRRSRSRRCTRQSGWLIRGSRAAHRPALARASPVRSRCRSPPFPFCSARFSAASAGSSAGRAPGRDPEAVFAAQSTP